MEQLLAELFTWSAKHPLIAFAVSSIISMGLYAMPNTGVVNFFDKVSIGIRKAFGKNVQKALAAKISAIDDGFEKSLKDDTGK